LEKKITLTHRKTNNNLQTKSKITLIKKKKLHKPFRLYDLNDKFVINAIKIVEKKNTLLVTEKEQKKNMYLIFKEEKEMKDFLNAVKGTL
jgi:hypothetical protein